MTMSGYAFAITLLKLTMERNEKTIAVKLISGDRFYYQGDKKKRAFQMMDGQPEKAFVGIKLLCCPVDIVDNKLIRQQLRTRQYRGIYKDTKVVYLRNVNDSK